jgi:hypothetical protein
MVYNYCELNHSNHRFNEEEKAAGKPWLKMFLKRAPTVASKSSRSIINAKWLWVRPLLVRVVLK